MVKMVNFMRYASFTTIQGEAGKVGKFWSISKTEKPVPPCPEEIKAKKDMI